MNALPRAESEDGTAVAAGAEGSEMNVRPVAARLILVVVHLAVGDRARVTGGRGGPGGAERG